MKRERRGAPARTKWLRRMEAATLAHAPAELRGAKRAFRKELSREDQLALLRELVDTRAAELCRAYRNLVAVSYGYGTHQRRGGRRVRKDHCITFLVKRKWRKKTEEESDQTLPTELFAYWTIKGVRTLCLVPTDVECATDYGRVRPQAGVRQVSVVAAGLKPETGAIACAIKRSSLPGLLFAVSCRHVLGLTKRLHPRLAIGAELHVDDHASPDVVGTSLSVAGALQDAPPLSFDAQLAKVTDPDALRKATAGVLPTDFARNVGEIPDRYLIRAPGRDIVASKVRFVPRFSVDYGCPGANDVQHALLIESQVAGDATIGGDSGSAVTTVDGAKLLGMHIAGGDDLAYMIPAWELFKPENYHGMAASETLALV